MAIAIQTLRDEGVLEVGAVFGTSFVYVITRARTCFFHAAELPNRRLDEYGAYRAVYWIERGLPSCRVATDLGITESELRRALLAIGYARMSPAQLAQLADARANPARLAQLADARVKRKIGNRRGRLVRIEDHACVNVLPTASVKGLAHEERMDDH
jgi:hypothetical protein